MKAQLLDHALPHHDACSLVAEDSYLASLLALHSAWKGFWQAWLREYFRGNKLPRQAEQGLLQALHGPETQIPETQRAHWQALQLNYHEILHQLQSDSARTSKDFPCPTLVPTIDAALALEQQCFEEIVAYSKNLGEIDMLTGLPNRRRMEQDLIREQALVERKTTSFIAMIDVDHFKSLNDTHGHAAGDAVLRAIAQSLRSALRHYDGLYRYGGEEFLAILPGLSEESALLTAERLCRHVAATPLQTVDGYPLHVTVSIGITPLLPGGAPHERMAMADTALYQAKQGGRNQARLVS